MFRSTVANIGLLAAVAAAGIAAPAPAQSPQRSGYVARIAEPAAARTLIVRDRLWRCDAAGVCQGPASTSPAVACALVARQAGPLAGFEANGRALDAAALARCNARVQ